MLSHDVLATAALAFVAGAGLGVLYRRRSRFSRRAQARTAAAHSPEQRLSILARELLRVREELERERRVRAIVEAERTKSQPDATPPTDPVAAP